MKFGFCAKHRGTWPVALMCEALDVSRSGFYAWLTRPRSLRSIVDEVLGIQVRQSFVGSDRTYGARRVWHDVLAVGHECGLHRVERLMWAQGLRARPRRRGLPVDRGARSAIADNVLDRQFQADLATGHNAALRSRKSINELTALARGGKRLVDRADFVLLDCGSRDIKFVRFRGGEVADMGWNAECGASMGFTIELLSTYYQLDYAALPVPATGFSMDLRELARLSPDGEPRGAILAPWPEDDAMHAEAMRLRAQGERVVLALPGHDGTWREAGCDRILVRSGDNWIIESLKEG